MAGGRGAGGDSVGVCIAVDAAVGAGVVGTDFGAFGAAALFARWLFLGGKSVGIEQPLDDSSIHTVGLLDLLAEQIFSAAGMHLDPVRFGDVRKLVGQVDLLLFAHICDSDAGVSAKLLEIAFDLALFGDNAEVASLDHSFQLCGQLAESSEEVIIVAN